MMPRCGTRAWGKLSSFPWQQHPKNVHFQKHMGTPSIEILEAEILADKFFDSIVGGLAKVGMNTSKH